MAEKKKLGSGRHLSAIKRNRQNIKRNVRNKSALSTMRSSMKELRDAIEKADAKAAQEQFPKTQQLVDRAIKSGLLHASTGQRYIGRLHKRVQKLAA